jgi:hypothetical protein
MIPIRPFQRDSWLRYGVYSASRLLPHPWLRSGVVAAMRGCINGLHGAPGGPPSARTRTALKALADDGMALVDGPLTSAQIDDILAYLATAPVARGASAPVTADTKGVASATYDLPTILACPHLIQAMNHPDILQIAAGFLGCRPTLSGVGLRWSFASDAVSEVQKFHRDAEDWRILRLFIYLTDVHDDCGPHQFVGGSHKTMGRLRLRPYSDDDIDRQFGRDRVLTVSGPRGTAFMGNMWGVHRGVPPTGRARLLFNCTYTMTATPIFRYEPVKVPDGHLYDGYTNRLLIC